jgi:hypothetical protein
LPGGYPELLKILEHFRKMVLKVFVNLRQIHERSFCFQGGRKPVLRVLSRAIPESDPLSSMGRTADRPEDLRAA